MVNEIQEIREKLADIGQISNTSIKFQDDLLRFIAQNSSSGSSIVEVGCYHGGLTAQLALLSREFGIVLHVIDIDRGYLQMAANAVTQVGLIDYVRFHAMDLKQFVSEAPESLRPVLIFIDGDHRYEGVVADIRAIQSMPNRPYACAFHDYSLRYADGPLTNVRVDNAIKDEFGFDVPKIPIGEIAGIGSTLRTEPAEDRHFHEVGESEGVLIILDSISNSAA